MSFTTIVQRPVSGHLYFTYDTSVSYVSIPMNTTRSICLRRSIADAALVGLIPVRDSDFHIVSFFPRRDPQYWCIRRRSNSSGEVGELGTVKLVDNADKANVFSIGTISDTSCITTKSFSGNTTWILAGARTRQHVIAVSTTSAYASSSSRFAIVCGFTTRCAPGREAALLFQRAHKRQRLSMEEDESASDSNDDDDDVDTEPDVEKRSDGSGSFEFVPSFAESDEDSEECATVPHGRRGADVPTNGFHDDSILSIRVTCTVFDVICEVSEHERHVLLKHATASKLGAPNVVISPLVCGVPGRETIVHVLVALTALTPSTRIVVDEGKTLFLYKELDTQRRLNYSSPQGLYVECSCWPKSLPYYHGIGQHTAGPAVLYPPYSSMLLRPCPQLGEDELEVVAVRDIPQGTVFLYGAEYSVVSSPFSWATQRGDVLVGGSVARYINLFYGFADEPNVELKEYDHKGQPMLCLVAIRPISEGEALLVASYGRYHDFEVLRKVFCDGQRLSLGSLPSKMLSFIDPFTWLQADDVVVKEHASARGKLSLFRVVSTSRTTVKLCELKQVHGVHYILESGKQHKTKVLFAKQLIPLLLGEDYEVVPIKSIIMNGMKREDRHAPFAIRVSQSAHCELIRDQVNRSLSAKKEKNGTNT
eukprot:PhM_4_TR6140/c0_g1_i1/m.1659